MVEREIIVKLEPSLKSHRNIPSKQVVIKSAAYSVHHTVFTTQCSPYSVHHTREAEARHNSILSLLIKMTTYDKKSKIAVVGAGNLANTSI